MKEIIEFTVESKGEFNGEIKKSGKISFQLVFENESCVDGYSYNPTSGWGLYTTFQLGWSEMDEDINELLQAVKDFSQSMKCQDIISDCTDIGECFEINYYCDGHVNENKEYAFMVIITDIDEIEYEDMI